MYIKVFIFVRTVGDCCYKFLIFDRWQKEPCCRLWFTSLATLPSFMSVEMQSTLTQIQTFESGIKSQLYHPLCDTGKLLHFSEPLSLVVNTGIVYPFARGKLWGLNEILYKVPKTIPSTEQALNKWLVITGMCHTVFPSKRTTLGFCKIFSLVTSGVS
jgi:hypothetical protein